MDVRILVVDDDVDVVEIVKLLLMSIEFPGLMEIQTVSGSRAVQEACEFIQRREFTAVLTDWEMPCPTTGGIEVITAAMANGIPINRIAVMSAGPNTRSAIEEFLIAEKLDVITFFPKPLDCKALRRWVGKFFVLQPAS